MINSLKQHGEEIEGPFPQLQLVDKTDEKFLEVAWAGLADALVTANGKRTGEANRVTEDQESEESLPGLTLKSHQSAAKRNASEKVAGSRNRTDDRSIPNRVLYH